MSPLPVWEAMRRSCQYWLSRWLLWRVLLVAGLALKLTSQPEAKKQISAKIAGRLEAFFYFQLPGQTGYQPSFERKTELQAQSFGALEGRV